MKRYEQVPHTADLAVRVYSKKLSGIFENAAFAMFDMMADLKDLVNEEERVFNVEGPDPESILIFWLNDLLCASATDKILFSEFHVLFFSNTRIVANAKGGSHGFGGRIHAEIKSATYHDIDIRKTETGYQVTVVFDV